jgi:hypothetical protein
MFKAIMEAKFEDVCRFFLYWYVMSLLSCMLIEYAFPLGQKSVLFSGMVVGAVMAGLLIRWVNKYENKEKSSEDK